MKTCQDTAELLSDYLENQLPKEDADLLKSHISDCPACEAFIKSFRVASETTRKVLLRQIPQDFNHRLTSFLRERTKQG
ncbi:MAG: zf-HC2 domain-containing protein [Deltaproteobacteria bacterium]|nr:zf-HC2 domain-containing protein [Deltaproteobacteria bacterium]